MEKLLVPIAFAGGIDTKTDSKWLVKTRLQALQNGIFLNAGAIAKRWGYTALSRGVIGQGTGLTACAAIQHFNNELMLYDGSLAYSYMPSDAAWAKRGQLISVIESNQRIVANAAQQLSPDFGIAGGVECYVWEDSRGASIRYSLWDSASGAVILNDQLLAQGFGVQKPKVIAVGGKLVILFTSTIQSLFMAVVDPAQPSIVPLPVVIRNDMSVATPFFDACAVVGQARFFVAYYGTAPGTKISLLQANLDGSTQWWVQAIDVTTNNPGRAINVCSDNVGNAWVTYLRQNLSDDVYFAGYANNGTGFVQVPTAAFTIGLIVGGVQSISSIWANSLNAFPAEAVLVMHVEAVGSQTYNNLIYKNVWVVGGALAFPANAPSVFARSVGLASKPFVSFGHCFVNVAFQSPLQATYFTLEDAGQVVAKALAQIGGGLVASSDYILPECPQLAPGIFKYANLARGAANSVAGAIYALLGVNATKLDFIDSNHFLSAPLAGSLYTVGGILQSYDGVRYVEHGFHVYPEGFTVTPSAMGGHMADGIYQYVVTYEWPDNNQLTQYSTPSANLQATVAGGGGNGSVAVKIPTLRLTKKANVRIVVYRTTASGTVLYRVTSALAPLYNDPTVDTVTFTDTLVDANITGNQLLYTQFLQQNAGNPVLPNAAPPACTVIDSYATRLCVNSADDPYTLWLSQPSVAGFPAQFSAFLTYRIDPEAGAITAIKRLDDKLVIFTKSRIYFVIFNGPTNTGDGSDLVPPTLIPSGGVGCVNPSSVVLTPMGLMFQSANGIYLLDRGLNVTYKGAPVEAFNGQAISSATVVPNQWVIFTTTGGTAIVYDYHYDQWSTFTNHAAVDSDVYIGQGGAFAWANAAGQVFLQNGASFSDAGQPISLYLKTAPFNFDRIQGYQRVYHALLLGQRFGTHTLGIACGFDYQAAATRFATINVDRALGIVPFGGQSPFGTGSPFGGNDPNVAVYQFRVDILQKCESMWLEITETDAAPGNQALSLSALTLVLGIKRGQYRGIGTTKQFGAN